MSAIEYQEVRVNGERLWERLMSMAKIGATAKGGVNRVALTETEKAGRDRFIMWCEAAGCTVEIDAIGNIFARRNGLDGSAPAVLAGSHLDSQPTGGKFDGVYGVLAALEVVETLNDHGLATAVPLDIVSWTNEEGARFAPGMVGSGVFAGVHDLEFGLSREDRDGITIGAALQKIGYAGKRQIGTRPLQAAFELHIEQGPILEAQGKTIGVVTAVQGARWYEIILEGQEAHAGSTPMGLRHDPVQALIPLLRRLYALAAHYAPQARLTIGELVTEPGAINTVPGLLRVKVDMRHPDRAILSTMHEKLVRIVSEESAEAGIGSELRDLMHAAPVTFASSCVTAVARAAERLGLEAMEIVSGAGHDAVYLTRVAPTSMIFIPCAGGLSHNELESATQEDVVAGANVLLQAILEMAL